MLDRREALDLMHGRSRMTTMHERGGGRTHLLLAFLIVSWPLTTHASLSRWITAVPTPRGGCTRSIPCMAVVVWPLDPRIPVIQIAGTEHVGFSRTRQTLLACTKQRRVAFREWYKG